MHYYNCSILDNHQMLLKRFCHNLSINDITEWAACPNVQGGSLTHPTIEMSIFQHVARCNTEALFWAVMLTEESECNADGSFFLKILSWNRNLFILGRFVIIIILKSHPITFYYWWRSGVCAWASVTISTEKPFGATGKWDLGTQRSFYY